MPIYGYQCGECNHELEALQKMSEQPLKDCPACNKPALSKQVSAPAFRLSGSGWYETDFKTGTKKNLAGNTADSTKTDSAKTASTKTDSAKTASTKSDSTKTATATKAAAGS